MCVFPVLAVMSEWQQFLGLLHTCCSSPPPLSLRTQRSFSVVLGCLRPAPPTPSGGGWIKDGESGISLQTRRRWDHKQINHYLHWALSAALRRGGPLRKCERQNKGHTAGDKQSGSIARIAQRIAALSQHEFRMKKEIQEWNFFFFLTLIRAGLVLSAAKRLQILEEKRASATFFLVRP